MAAIVFDLDDTLYPPIRAYADSKGYGNWELSTDRANSARRAMERFGLRVGQIDAVRGYADTRLHTPKQPLDARNRRI